MKSGRFIGRERELEAMESEYKRSGSGFMVIFGRRRVGKTRLIQEFMTGKEGVYYLAADEKDTLQIREIQEMLASYLGDDIMASLKFEGWKEFFRYLERVWPADKKLVLAIDEVTYIIKNNRSFLSYLQQFWDRFLSGTKTTLILSGSLVNMVLTDILGGGSPLYGRRTLDIHLRPFRFGEAVGFMEGMNVEEQIRIYSILGGVPKYLLEGDRFPELLKNKFFGRNGFFYREGMFLLSEEFRNPSTYSIALRAIAEGKASLKEIADFAGMDGKRMSAYLDMLLDLDLIRREIPITAQGKRLRRGVYSISDNFLAFWYRFVHPNRSLIEMDLGEDVFKKEENSINSFIGKRFEEICRDVLREAGWPKVGRWWGSHLVDGEKKQEEIDIVALNEGKKEILFGEVKWKNRAIGCEVLNDLKRKASLVAWNSENRTERYLLVSKAGFTKKCVERMEAENIIYMVPENLIDWRQNRLLNPNP